METLEGVRITYIVFKADDGEYAVVRGLHEGKDIMLVGGLYQLNEGTVIDAVGEWTYHSRYGQQFKVHAYLECRPKDLYGIEAYLKSGLIEGIGEVVARSIVEHFKEQTFDILDKHPDRLAEVHGIGPERMKAIKDSWAKHKIVRELILFLSAYGLSMTYILRTYKAYGDDAIDKIKENPYKLVDDIEGITFQMADALALNMGMSKTSYQRCRSGILYYLSTIGQNGHCFATYGDVLSGACKLLGVPHNLLDRAMQHMASKGDIVIEDNFRVYPKLYYDYEIDVAQDIKRIMQGERGEPLTMIEDYDNGIEYTPKQMEAIKAAVCGGKFIVITGGPGSGKTTITRAIVDNYRENGKAIRLASPTGRAAKVLSEATGHEASTIHRLLEFVPGLGFGYNEDNPIDADLFIFDEMSMVDLPLMRHLLRAIPDHATVVLVGDDAQIPSVGAGNVLADIINSGVVPVYFLDVIFRQAEGSSIKIAAQQIKEGILPDLSNPEGTDFFFIKNLDEEAVAQMIVKLRTTSIPAKRGVDPLNDIHVVAPMYKGEAGVTRLNALMQAVMNPKEEGVKYGSTFFKVGDKVMQTRNDYDKDVYNGTVGIAEKINPFDNSLEVDFGNYATVPYTSLELGDLDLAYATTVHKAQGSEYPVVIIPLVHTHGRMWYRKLIYTAVTRAKSMVILIGSENILRSAISNVEDASRNTRLWARLQSIMQATE